ncbi:MAG TPA: AI-2E family transporter [Opitutaceae bacterium]|nr:AI-2E family transporter [Opitutaceae bacterium]
MPSDTPTINERTATRLILIGICLAALAVLIWRVSDILVVAFGGVVLAAMLRALAMPLARRTGWRDRWCVLAVVAALFIVFCALGWLFGQQATSQAHELGQQLPAAVRKVIGVVQQHSAGKRIVTSIRESLGSSKTLANVGVAAGAVASAAIDLILVIFLSIYFAIDPELYRNGVLRLLPPPHRRRVGRALDDAGQALQRWLLGQVIAMATVGTLVGIGLALVGVPLAFALGVVAALLEFVPVVGPILFSIPGLLLAFAKGPETVLYALMVYLVVQQVEGNVIIPLLQRWAAELPPVVGLLAIVAVGLLLGLPGVVFATPMAVVVMRLVQHLYVEDTLENGRAQAEPNSRAMAK